MANPRAKNWFFQCDNPSGVDNDIINQVGHSQLVAFMICGRKQVEGGNALYGYVNLLDRKRRTEIAGQFPPQTVLTHAKGNVLNNTNTVRSECIEVREFGGIEFASTQGKTHDPDLIKMREAIKQQWSEQDKFEEFGSKWIHLGHAMEKSVKKERKDEATEKLKTQMLKATLRPWQIQAERELMSQNNRQILFVYDSDGNVGKSYFAKYLMAKYDAFVSDTTAKDDVIFCYDDQPVCVFDLTRKAAADMDQEFLEKMKDGVVHSRKYHSHVRIFAPPKIIVLMNPEPKTDVLSLDR
jgi:hypothetical protein